MRRSGATLLVGIVAAISGCTGSLLDSKIPAPTVYVLSAAPAVDDSGPAAPIDLAVSLATAAPGLNTERLAVIHEARRLDYFLNAQWGAALPEVAQNLVVASLQNQHLFRSVMSEQVRVNASYWMELEVRDFQAEYAREGEAPTIRVTFVGSIIRLKDRKLLGIAPATATVVASDNRLGAVVSAFESAAQQAALALGQRTNTLIADAGAQ